jgi:hypothetical protein
MLVSELYSDFFRIVLCLLCDLGNNEDMTTSATNTITTRCSTCRKTREVIAYTIEGGATYRRAGRTYKRHICRDCCAEIAEWTRFERFGRAQVYGCHLDHIKKACEAFGIAVDDLPNDTFDDANNGYKVPLHPIKWQYHPLFTDAHRQQVTALWGVEVID